jgi:hypothetical protein
MSQPIGPIEERRWPAKICARVVSFGEHPRIHGYDVRGDLALHYRFVDVVLLALTGEIDVEASAAFDVALTFASPTTVAEAPTHAAMLAQLCGSRTAGVVAVAATGLAEQSRTIVGAHEAILSRLALGSLDELDASFIAQSDGERAIVASLAERLGAFRHRVPALAHDVCLDTALVAVFVACGLHKREHLELALTLAKLPIACAEALTTTPGAFADYPMNVPTFVYKTP